MSIMKRLKELACAAAVCGLATGASAATVTASVNGTDNIYHANWGSSHNGLNVDVTGRGTAATAAEDGGTAVNFAGLGSLRVTATGSVVDRGRYATSPGGSGGGNFNGLPVYALIGVWSSTSAFVTAIGDSFFVGGSASLFAPLAKTAYLFLGDNDGIFHDNSGTYGVEISYEYIEPQISYRYIEPAAVVPLPAALPLLGTAFGMMFLMGGRRRRSQR